MKAVSAARVALYLALAAAGCAADLATKSWAFARLGMPPDSETVWLVDHVLGVTTSLNEGALLGVGQGRGTALAALAIAAVVGIVVWLLVGGAASDRLLTVALGLVTGGVLGNLYDRLGLPGLVWQDALHEPGARVYAVRDWIHFQIEGLVDWPIFNLADSLLVAGAILLIWHALRGAQRRKPEPGSAAGP
jgi:signal peptidase II